MLFFGHIGVTLGVAKACDTLISMAPLDSSPGSTSGFKSAGVNTGRPSGYERLKTIKQRIGHIDYRLVIIGSLLPDLIDKPIFFLVESASLSGRDYAHSLLFNLVMLAGGLALTGYRKSWLLALSFSSFMHLVFDRMWTVPVTLFWPLLGPFLRGERNAFVPEVYYGFFAPINFIPEIVGLAILFLVGVRLVKRKAVTGFIKNGTLV